MDCSTCNSDRPNEYKGVFIFTDISGRYNENLVEINKEKYEKNPDSRRI